MAAPDFGTLYDFETPFELAASNAIEDTLTAAGITNVALNVSRDSGTDDTPRIDIQFSTGVAMPQRTTIGQANPKQVPNAFEGVFTIRLSTTRPTETDNAAIHGMLRGLIRYALSAGAQAFDESDIPYWQILQMLPESSTPQLYDEKQQDITELSFHVWFAIRNDAWPVDTPPGTGEFLLLDDTPLLLLDDTPLLLINH